MTQADAGGNFARIPLLFNEMSRQDPQLLSTPDGERLLFANYPVPGQSPATRALTPSFIAERHPSGWEQTWAQAPGDRVDLSQLSAVSGSLSSTLNYVYGVGILGGTLDPADDDGEHGDLYFSTLGGPFSLASPPADGSDPAEDPTLLDTDFDFDAWLYVLQTEGTFLVGTPAGGREVVSVLEEGPVNSSGPLNLAVRPRLSRDGDRVVFLSRDFDNTGPYRIWVRLRSQQRTLLVSGKEPGVTGEDVEARLDILSDDGSSVLFTTPQALTLDDADEQVDLYRFDIAAEDTELVSTAAPGAPSDGHGDSCSPTYGASGCEVSPGVYSADGSTAYFISPEPLDVGAVPNAPNLYVNRSGLTRLVAVLADDDANPGEAGWLAADRANRPASVSADGGRMAFESRARLTSYDNEGVKEVHLYDAGLNQVQCVSCPTEDGLGPNREADLRDTDADGPSPMTEGPYATRGRNLANGGAQVFFETPERLSTRDVNGEYDVYEFDADSATTTLISSGRGADGSYYLDNSVDGEDVFFFSTELLVDGRQDRNGEVWKIFDARRGGGFPGAGDPACGVADCRGGVAPSSPFAVPASSLVRGEGNVGSPRRKRCPRGKRRVKARNGKVRCVARKHASRHTNDRRDNSNRRAGR